MVQTSENQAISDELIDVLVGKFVQFIETGNPPAGLFTPDVFLDFTSPLWRQQAQGIDGMVRIRKAGHPGPGTVPRYRCDATRSGFVIEWEEAWRQGGQDWYCREMARADLVDGLISALSVYCTGDWDAARQARHRQEVTLLRP